MVTSVIGVLGAGSGGGSSSSPTSSSFGDFDFELSNGRWFTEIGGKRYGFDFLPGDTSFFSVDSQAINLMKGTLEVDITYDFNDSSNEAIALSQYYMAESFAVMSRYLRLGSLYTNEFDVPIITCADASAAVPVLVFRSANVTQVTVEGNCIIAEASNKANFIRIKDRLLYGILEVIDG